MKHPFLSNPYQLVGYLLVLLLCGITQSTFYYGFCGLQAAPAVADFFIYIIWQIVLGYFLWYPILFNSYHKDILTKILIGSTILAIFLIICIGVPYLISSVALSYDESYLRFAEKILPFRVSFTGTQLMIIIIIYNSIILNKDLKDYRTKEAILMKQFRESELKALKSQLNPHFLFNSLNSISSLTLTNPEKAREMLIQLSDFLRFTLKQNNSDIIKLKIEIENMQRFLKIEKIRFGNQLLFTDEIDDNCLSAKLPAMILQPIYENSIKHGLNESIEPITIKTVCTIDGDNLIISISNNYDSNSVSRKGAGVGLSNIREILRNLYGQSDLMSVVKTDDTFTVTLIIPQI